MTDGWEGHEIEAVIGLLTKLEEGVGRAADALEYSAWLDFQRLMMDNVGALILHEHAKETKAKREKLQAKSILVALKKVVPPIFEKRIVEAKKRKAERDEEFDKVMGAAKSNPILRGKAEVRPDPRAGDLVKLKGSENLWCPYRGVGGRSDGDRIKYDTWRFVRFPDCKVYTIAKLDSVEGIVHLCGSEESVEFWPKVVEWYENAGEDRCDNGGG